MDSTLLYGVAIVPAIIGLTQVCKELGAPDRAAPAIAVVFGILAALAQAYAGKWPWIPAAVVGISLGLSAVGLYSTSATIASGSAALRPQHPSGSAAGYPVRSSVQPAPVSTTTTAPAPPPPAPPPSVTASGAPLR